jgi:predicted ArsR family transcriptional regulator
MGMTWYEVLYSARRIGSQEGVEKGKKVLLAVPFTSASLAEKTGLTPAIASAWIGKFQRWGYVVLAGKGQSTGGRPARLYELTKWGLRYKRKKKGEVSLPGNMVRKPEE